MACSKNVKVVTVILGKPKYFMEVEALRNIFICKIYFSKKKFKKIPT